MIRTQADLRLMLRDHSNSSNNDNDDDRTGTTTSGKHHTNNNSLGLFIASAAAGLALVGLATGAAAAMPGFACTRHLPGPLGVLWEFIKQ